jgi:hypothetical protein
VTHGHVGSGSTSNKTTAPPREPQQSRP